MDYDRLLDFLIAVIFDDSFNMMEMWKIPYRFVKENAIWSDHQNGYIFYAKPNVLILDKDVEKIM